MVLRLCMFYQIQKGEVRWTKAHTNLCLRRLDLLDTLIVVTIKCPFSRGRFVIGIIKLQDSVVLAPSPESLKSRL